MQSLAYLVPGRGLEERELNRREHIANDIVRSDVSVIAADRGPKSIESEVEHEWSITGMLELIREHESEFDAFVIGCFGDPGISAARELTDTPVVGPAAATFHTAAQVSDRFTCLTVRETPASKRRQIRATHLDSQLASVRVVNTTVEEINSEEADLVRRMIKAGRDAVDEDGAESLIPGCMSLAFMQAHGEVQSELPVPVLDPATISLETAEMWARHDIRPSRVSYPKFDQSRYATLFDRQAESRPLD